MHVRAVVGSSTVTSDVKLAQLFVLGQLDVVTKVAVFLLVIKRGSINKTTHIIRPR